MCAREKMAGEKTKMTLRFAVILVLCASLGSCEISSCPQDLADVRCRGRCAAVASTKVRAGRWMGCEYMTKSCAPYLCTTIQTNPHTIHLFITTEIYMSLLQPPAVVLSVFRLRSTLLRQRRRKFNGRITLRELHVQPFA